ncbi:MAG: UDP-N-acetylglucosamine acyltransferase [Chloroflexi bacterium]|nr:UDP-N-acetylglucosamine acyltransferase [Chloroflexota bacterium]
MTKPKVVMGQGNIIEPTAVIGGEIHLGNGNYVGHFAVLTGPITLGDGNTISHHAVLVGPLTVGDGNYIGPHVTFGTAPQHNLLRWEVNPPPGEEHVIRIGNQNIFREYTTIHQPTESLTSIGDACYLMAYSHVPHDALLEDGVILANSVQIGGHTWIGQGANIGLGAVIHQHSSIGAYVMVGMDTVVNRDVPPFVMAAGNPVRVVGLNRVGLRRYDFRASELSAVRAALRALPARGGAEQFAALPERVARAMQAFAERSRRPRARYGERRARGTSPTTEEL